MILLFQVNIHGKTTKENDSMKYNTSIEKNHSDNRNDSIIRTELKVFNDTTTMTGRIKIFMNRWVTHLSYFIKEMKHNPGKQRQYKAYCAAMILSRYM